MFADMKRWRDWAIWYERDPRDAVSYSPTTTGVGAFADWKSKSQGNGRMTVKENDPSKKMVYTLSFPDYGMTSDAWLELQTGRHRCCESELGECRPDGEQPAHALVRAIYGFGWWVAISRKAWPR